jgi:hypothetical protein
MNTATQTASVTPVAVQAAMTEAEVVQILQNVHGASRKGLEDGTRIHIHYTAFGLPNEEAVKCATRAAELGLQRDRYTGRISRVWRAKNNDLLLTMWVELERDHMYRTLNASRGTFHKLVILGN